MTIKGKSKGNAIPTKAEVIPVERPARKGAKNKMIKGDTPQLLKMVGINESAPETSNTLLKIITEIIKRIMDKERLFLRDKKIRDPFILEKTRTINTMTNMATSSSTLKIRTRRIIARIGQILKMRL